MSVPATITETPNWGSLLAWPGGEHPAAVRYISKHCVCDYDWRGLRVKLSFDCKIHAPDMAYSFCPWMYLKTAD